MKTKTQAKINKKISLVKRLNTLLERAFDRTYGAILSDLLEVAKKDLQDEKQIFLKSIKKTKWRAKC